MTKNISILTTLFLFSFCLFGQNKLDIYEIKIGKYSFQTIDQDYFETKKSFTINIQVPQTIEPASSFDVNGNEHKSFDTTDHFLLTKLMDSIPLNNVTKFINTEIELFCNGKKIKVDEFNVEVFRADGKSKNPQIFSNKISSSSDIKKFINKCPPNSYIILDVVYSYKSNGEKIVLANRLGWKIIKGN